MQNFFPTKVRSFLPAGYMDGLEEIRVRAGQPVELLYGDDKVTKLCVVQREQVSEMLNYLSGYSLYAMEEELKQGFFTMEGGHRIGVVGRVSRTNSGTGKENEISSLHDISGLNIRVAHEKKGCAGDLVEQIRQKDNIYNTLIIAPPGVGKTTYLRDCIRILSSGDSKHKGLKVSVVDERSEIAACYQGVPQNDIGPRTDVLDNCPKERGMLMMIRAMSPQIIAIDELGDEADFQAVYQAIHSGSRILGTVHGESVKELVSKPYMKPLLSQKLIGRFVELHRNENGSRFATIYDENLSPLC